MNNNNESQHANNLKVELRKLILSHLLHFTGEWAIVKLSSFWNSFQVSS